MDLRLFRGLGLKILGLGSKAVFVLFFAPGLALGEFATYFVFSIYALIGGRVLSMGADNVVSYIVRGSVARAAYFLSAGNVYGLMSFVFFGVSLAAEGFYELFFLSVSFSFVLAGSSFYSGALRSHNNAFQEIRANLPWFFVCVFMLIFNGKVAADVFRYLIYSYVIANLLDFFALRKLGIGWGGLGVRATRRHFRTWRRWVPVSLSAIGVAGSLRSFPIVMGWLGMPVTDSMAYNFLIGEVVYQVCMVYVNQIHSRVSRRNIDLSLKYSVVVLGAFFACSSASVLGVYLLSLALESAIFDGLDYALLISVSLYCAALASFSFVRVFAWRDRGLFASVLVLVVQCSSFALCGLLLYFFGMNWQVVVYSAVILILMVYSLLFYLLLLRGR